MSEKRLFQFKNYNITSSYSVHNITQNFCFLAATNLKYRNYYNFFKFLLLLLWYVSLNPDPILRSLDKSYTIWETPWRCSTKYYIFMEPLNKKELFFIRISMSSLLSKNNEIKCTANEIKVTIIGITESKLDHAVLSLELQAKLFSLI